MSYCCYCLVSDKNPKSTYFGCTNNLARRLRQHNGEITGGARSTHGNRPWSLWYYVTGFGDNKRQALRFEWFVKFKHNKKFLKRFSPSSHRFKRLILTYNALSKVEDIAISYKQLVLICNNRLCDDLISCIASHKPK